MGFDLNVSVPALTVFIQGLLSFFSPCVLPMIPLYMGYLSGGTLKRDENGNYSYDQKKVMIHTFFFVVGVSFAFFLLGLGVSAMGVFFNSRQVLIARIGGIIVFMFGLYQLGIFGDSELLSREKRLPFKIGKAGMSPITALIMGFTFSFAWTPCVGPTLASVLLMTASASSKAMGFMLVGLYTLGFVIPFLLVGLFTTQILNLFKKRASIVKYTVKIGGVLMILMGLMMFTGKMNSITGYLSKLPGVGGAQQEVTVETEAYEEGLPETVESAVTETAEETLPETAETDSGERPTVPALDFSLMDQFGSTHTLDQYKGKTIFLNFWATWCPPCRNEMPDIQKLHEKYTAEEDSEVVILGVAAPNYGQEGSAEEITEFLDQNGYTYPVLMDTNAELFNGYGIYSFPTTFMIDSEGNVYGYVTGQLNEDIMMNIIEQTQNSRK